MHIVSKGDDDKIDVENVSDKIEIMYSEVINENVFVDLLKEKICTLESVNVFNENTKLTNESKDVIVHKSKDIVHESDYEINGNVIVEKVIAKGAREVF